MRFLGLIIIFCGFVFQDHLVAMREGDGDDGIFLQTVASCSVGEQVSGEGGSFDDLDHSGLLIMSKSSWRARLNPRNWQRKTLCIAGGLVAGGVTLTAIVAKLMLGAGEEQEKNQKLEDFLQKNCTNETVTPGWKNEVLSSSNLTFLNGVSGACDRSECDVLANVTQSLAYYVQKGLTSAIQRFCFCFKQRLIGSSDALDVINHAVSDTVIVPIGSGLENADPRYIVAQSVFENVYKNPDLCMVSES